ncbi:MAG: efflux RND transporter periplasmic adaptor subunit [Gemmatimonadota bacterium]|nr:efflux RND transporter periplasmic adaptor subunit [Gemmatimonadota bacterium]MDH3366851.1 efflux RND transporter periplasmic adaptor subunit [Gemmatimonadota bacterium]MDH3478596.1 efflux RND transporter periplasmic adaptor subunit [Gemmatimonadota bacterium]MDH3569547.1 efflux RND transporter periplasmic adaptor subunit [Gemmatimonadota bacterium]MDH5548358.1 efflux RND transporter periplasmic adaptor subunit [Gemmatimonadota bacterium]
MTRPYLHVLAAAVLITGCGGESQDSPMAGMTAEEHARMQAGGTRGAMDSAGQTLRQSVQLSAATERALGITYTTVRRESLTRSIRTVGRIEAPEPKVADITPKIDGFVEHLAVSYTGEAVRRGQPLLTLYSPMLVAAQEELLTAKRLADRVDRSSEEAWRNAQAMLDAARRRLAYWDISPDQIAAIEEKGQVTKTLTLAAPFAGIVLEKDVFEGQQVMAGMRLYRIADLSTVWVNGDVFEQDLQFVRVGSQAHIEVAAYPGVHIMGQVSFVYPTVEELSRTNRVRVTVPNRDLRLKPGMFATVYFDAPIGPNVLTVPTEAVVVTGERNLVFVRDTTGTLSPREVVVGARAGNRVQLLRGLEEGETIVASANFLVDAESRLGVTGGSMPGMQHTGHGSVIEPDTISPDTLPPSSEHRHD